MGVAYIKGQAQGANLKYEGVMIRGLGFFPHADRINIYEKKNSFNSSFGGVGFFWVGWMAR